ncbi:MAG: hypothetical protein OJF49_003875 [Ktedonobacterales bacterium]|nr:MAG: hypothetical protein OJF49_003875 [Ktedonobacterales bacterium]
MPREVCCGMPPPSHTSPDRSEPGVAARKWLARRSPDGATEAEEG